MSPTEPVFSDFPDPLKKYFLATRPAFLLATLVPVFLGLAYTHWLGVSVHVWHAILTILAALFLHAGVNVLNDYYDDLNGTDNVNEERVYPFTGGSRFIQNGVFSRQQMLRYGIYLNLIVVIIGVYLVTETGSALFFLGMIGLLIGWAYSAPPLRLNSRGFGELAILIGFSLLPFGTVLVQTGLLLPEVILIALPVGFLTTNLLYINQFPDRKADIKAGKLHWVARMDLQTARWGYLAIGFLAYSVLMLLILTEQLPLVSLISLLPVMLTLKAFMILWKKADQPQQLEPAIKMTILAMILHGGLLTLSFIIA